MPRVRLRPPPVQLPDVEVDLTVDELEAAQGAVDVGRALLEHGPSLARAAGELLARTAGARAELAAGVERVRAAAERATRARRARRR